METAIKNLDQSERVLRLAYSLKNKYGVDVIIDFMAYSSVNQIAVRIFYPKWEPNMTPTIDGRIYLDMDRDNNTDIIESLEDLDNNGFESNVYVIESKEKELQRKRELLEKLQKELA